MSANTRSTSESIKHIQKFLDLEPDGASGVTIGIGYDLGYNRVSQIQKDWSGKVSDADIEKLKKVSGLKADKAKKQLHRLQVTPYGALHPAQTQRCTFLICTEHGFKSAP